MIVSEVLFDQISLMSYVLLKYCFGTLHNLLTPIAVLLSYPTVRRSVVKVFVRGGTQQNNSVEITDDEVKKELGHLN